MKTETLKHTEKALYLNSNFKRFAKINTGNLVKLNISICSYELNISVIILTDMKQSPISDGDIGKIKCCTGETLVKHKELDSPISVDTLSPFQRKKTIIISGYFTV